MRGHDRDRSATVSSVLVVQPPQAFSHVVPNAHVCGCPPPPHCTVHAGGADPPPELPASLAAPESVTMPHVTPHVALP